MKKQIILLSLCSVVFLSGCSILARIVIGIKNPKIETKESLSGFLKKIGTPIETFYVCKDSISFMSMMKTVPGIPEAEFFDCNGNFIPYKKSAESCNAGIDSFLNQLMLNKTFATSFENINSRLVNLLDIQTNEALSLKQLPKSDYYVLLYFAKFTGVKMNKEHINIWIDEIEKQNQNSNLKMTYLLVSLDFMEFWGAGFSDTKLRISGYH